jgi:four helix bundle protein
MTKLKRFEELKCWQAARSLVKQVYTMSRTGQLAKDFDTKSQFKRAALSTMNNIAEGFGRFSETDFIRFLDYSQSSALEVQSMTYVLEDIAYVTAQQAESLREQAEQTKALTLGLILYLRKRTTS